MKADCVDLDLARPGALATAAPDDIVQAWLFPGSAFERISVALARHVQSRDLSDIGWLLELTGAPASLVRAIEAKPEIIRRLPGCGGIHLPVEERAADTPLVTEQVIGVAEIALASRVDFEARLGPCARVHLPLDGTTITRETGDAADAVVTVSDGALTVSWRDAEMVLVHADAGSAVHRAAGVGVSKAGHVGGCRVDVDSALVRRGVPPVFDLSDHVAAEQVSILSRCLEIVDRAEPAVSEELAALVTDVGPLTAPSPRAQFSSCNRRLPGIVYASLAEPLELASFLCHEYHHFKLFLLQDVDPLLAPSAITLAAPWRPDRRPADGVLHGTYVLFGVSQLFSHIFERFRPTLRGWRRLGVWSLCVAEGTGSLLAAPIELTPLGRLMVRTMQSANEDVMARTRRADETFFDIAARAISEHLALAGTGEQKQPWYLAV